MTPAELQALLAENAALRAALAEQTTALAERDTALSRSQALVEDQAARIERLQQRLDALSKLLFGVKAERVDPAQLSFPFLDPAQGPEEPLLHPQPPAPKGKPKRKGRRNGRTELPADLPRETIRHEPSLEERTCSCCGEPMREIGEERTEILDFRPASFVVQEHLRPKYACKPECGSGIVCAPLPPTPIERGRPGAGLLAEVIVRKYGDHLPLERQSGIFAREGVHLSKQTLCDWVNAMGFALRPVYQALREHVLAQPWLQTDETRLRVLKNKGWKHKKGNVWICASGPGQLFYEITETKAAKAIKGLLGSYEGVVQADAASGFDVLFQGAERVEAGCHAHARRRFLKAFEAGELRAGWVLRSYRELYQIEREAKQRGLNAKERQLLRQGRSKRILDALYAWLRELQPDLRPTSLLADAVGYTLNHEEALRRCLEDGRLELDNNRAERLLRKIALGRNNYLFAGSPRGAQTAVVLYSLVGSCKELGINPAEYLRDVIARLPTHPAAEVDALLPWAWQAAQAQA